MAPLPPTLSGDGSGGRPVRNGSFRYHHDMAMTLRLPPGLEAELRLAAEEDHRSANRTVLFAIEMYLARRETVDVKADPEALRALVEGLRAAVLHQATLLPERPLRIARSRRNISRSMLRRSRWSVVSSKR